MFSVKLKFLNSAMLKLQHPRTVNRVAMEVAEAAMGRHGKDCRVVPHGILSRGLIVAVGSQDLHHRRSQGECDRSLHSPGCRWK